MVNALPARGLTATVSVSTWALGTVAMIRGVPVVAGKSRPDASTSTTSASVEVQIGHVRLPPDATGRAVVSNTTQISSPATSAVGRDRLSGRSVGGGGGGTGDGSPEQDRAVRSVDADSARS